MNGLGDRVELGRQLTPFFCVSLIQAIEEFVDEAQGVKPLNP